MAIVTEREKYLRGLAKEYGVDMYVVRSISDMLWPNEDHDGLITALEDWEDFVSGGFDG